MNLLLILIVVSAVLVLVCTAVAVAAYFGEPWEHETVEDFTDETLDNDPDT